MLQRLQNILLLSLFISILTPFASKAVEAAPFTAHAMLVFGDGTTDNGNTYKKYGFPVAPYWHGRFSNGPAYDELLAYDLQMIPNPKKHPNYSRNKLFYVYSYYNAFALKRNVVTDSQLPNYVPPTLRQEVNTYLAHKLRLYAAASLVLIDIGSNDITSTICLKNPLNCLQLVVDEVTLQMQRLCAAGLTHFLIILPGDVQTEPGYKDWINSANNRSIYAAMIPNYRREFTDLKIQIERQYPRSKVIIYDTVRVEKGLTKKFSAPVSLPCYDDKGVSIYTKQSAPVCKNPSQHVYFDNYYYGEHMNKLFADDVFKFLKDNNWTRKKSTGHWW